MFSGIVDAAARKRRGSVDGMEMRVRARRGEDGKGKEPEGGWRRKEEEEEEEEETLHRQRSGGNVTQEYTRSKEKLPLVPASSQTNSPLPGAEVSWFLHRSFKFTFTE
ncbi:hypothetical protein KM043_013722 [Ampulex compressa]|nr:hypothetical protein KM043_013722 [Ampulex compressa]